MANGVNSLIYPVILVCPDKLKKLLACGTIQQHIILLLHVYYIGYVMYYLPNFHCVVQFHFVATILRIE